MNRINYSTQFTGTCETSDYSKGAFKTSTVAPIGSIFAEEGEGSVELLTEGNAEIKSTMVMTGNGTFQQYGTITFEDSRDRLHFSTQGAGQIEENSDGKQATATLKIDRGEGRFRHASGRIASEFSVDENGIVTDNQIGAVRLD